LAVLTVGAIGVLYRKPLVWY